MADVRTVLGFDFGLRRIGLAVGQDLTGTAKALTTLEVRHGRIDWDAIGELVEQWQPQLFVLGRPTTADGRAPDLEAAIDRFARRLEGRFRRPVSFVDERLSSYAAADEPETRRVGLDAVAARLILETWFAEHAPA